MALVIRRKIIMSPRNLKLLIIILIAATAIAFGFLYFYNTTDKTGTVGSTAGTNFLSQIWPFGGTNNELPTATEPTDISGFEPAPATEAPAAKLRKVSDLSIAGYIIFQKERFKELPVIIPVIEPASTDAAGTASQAAVVKPIAPPTEFVPALRYAERATGNIYQAFADKLDERKFTTTIIPQIHEAFFGNHGDSVIFRYLKTDGRTIETFAGILPKEVLGADSANTSLKGIFLPENISDMTISRDTSRMFYIFSSGTNAVGISAGLAGEKRIQLFDSPFTEWLSEWPNSRMVTLTTKPSANVPGYMYGIDPNLKDFNKILGGIPGLTTLTSPSGRLIAYGNRDLTLYLYDTGTGNTQVLPAKTLPEKCVWGKLSETLYCAVPKFVLNDEYPDAWYRDEISFSDSIWKIDVKTGTYTVIADVYTLAGEDADGIKLALDEAEKYLFFINKKDFKLWEIAL